MNNASGKFTKHELFKVHDFLGKHEWVKAKNCNLRKLGIPNGLRKEISKGRVGWNASAGVYVYTSCWHWEVRWGRERVRYEDLVINKFPATERAWIKSEIHKVLGAI